MEKYRINIILLSSISLLVHTGFGILFPIFPKILENFGKSATELGLLIGAFGFMYVIFSPLFGSWADNHGKKKIIVIGLIGFAVSNILYLIALYLESFELFLFARAIEGAFASAVFPASITMVSDFVPESEIAKNIGIVTAGNGIGMIIGPILGGYLFDISIEFPFYISTILAFITIFWVLFTLKEHKSFFQSEDRFSSSTGIQSMRTILRERVKVLPDPKLIFFIFILVDMIFLLTWMLIEPGLSFYIYNDLVLTPFDYGIFIAIYSLFAVIGGGFLGGLSDKLGRRPMIVLGLICNAVFYFMMLFATNLISILFAAIVGGLSLGFIGPAMKALLSTASPKESRTTIFGIASGLAFLGNIFGPIAGGYLYEKYSIFILFIIVIVLSLIGAILGLFLSFKPKQFSTI